MAKKKGAKISQTINFGKGKKGGIKISQSIKPKGKGKIV